jgi:hypothetical protein
MNRFARWSRALLPFAGFFGAACLSGCALEPVDEAGERVGEAEQEEIDIGTNVWRKYFLRKDSSTGTEIGQIIGINQNVGGFVADNEYWYVDKAVLGGIGTSDVYISHSDGAGTPSTPSYSNMQSFTLPTNPTGGWGTGWTSDPLASAGKLYQNGAHSLRLQTTGTGVATTVTAVAWYQVILSSNSPANITPSSTFSYTSGGSVSVGTGYLGYDINQAP